MSYDNIPTYLKKIGKYCIADAIKTPINPKTKGNAMPNNPDTFTTFDYAVSHKGEYPYLGIGFFDNLCGIDIDDCVSNGELSALAKDIIATANSYTEYSVSGKGIHILFLCNNSKFDKAKYYVKKNEDALLKDGITGAKGLEIYFANQTSRYFTITGNTILTELNTVDYSIIEGILEKYMLRPVAVKSESISPSTQNNAVQGNFKPDIEYWLSKDNKLCELWYSSPSGKGGNESETDQSLMNKLAYWCNKDAQLMNDMFVSSPYFLAKDYEHKKKWAREDYRNGTIQKAIDITNKTAEEVNRDYQLQKELKSMQPITAPEQPKEINIDENRVKSLISKFNEYIRNTTEHSLISTGFQYLDKAIGGGLWPKLYTINAMPSIGKTAFALQIADNVAKAGNDAIIFSLEMDFETLIARSISRYTYKLNEKLAKTENDILDGNRWVNYSQEEINTINQAQEQYLNECADNISIYSGRATASQIKETVKQYIEKTGKRPVVIVDYLQIIIPENSLLKADRRTHLIDAVDTLNSIKRELKCPVIVISSVSRANYNSEMDMSSGKETGEIEYTADCVINMEYAVNRFYFQNGSSKEKPKDDYVVKREIESLKRRDIRPIKLTLSKNRGAMINEEIYLRGRLKYSCFEESTETEIRRYMIK